MQSPKNMSRALRRHHRQRLKKSRMNYWGGYSIHTEPMDARRLGVVVNTPQPCSCMGCGNSRYWFGEETMQERRAKQHTIAELIADVPWAGDGINTSDWLDKIRA